MKARGWNSERSFVIGWLTPGIQTRREVEARFPAADPIAFLNGVDDRLAADCYRLNLLFKQRDLPVAVTPLNADKWAGRIAEEYEREGQR